MSAFHQTRYDRPAVALPAKLAIVLGIRPDVIRASLVLKKLRASDDVDLHFIWSGQHYSDNMKDVFFRELDVAPPDVELDAAGETDAALAGDVIRRLHPVLASLQPDAAIFLGDTNTVLGAIAAAQLNVPIVHIEGGMRSYDWRMPEEKYRSIVDHLSDVIYVYFREYREQAIAEGINPDNVVVVQNLIVDVLDEHYFKRREEYEELASPTFFAERGIERGGYYLATCHRRENIESEPSLRAIVDPFGGADAPLFFPPRHPAPRQPRGLAVDPPAHTNPGEPPRPQEGRRPM